MNRTELLSATPTLSSASPVSPLRRLCTRRRVALAFHLAWPYLAMAAVLLLR